MTVLVLIPTDPTTTIHPGSGVVTGGDRSDAPPGYLRVWYEGSTTATNLQRWADRVHCAADRMLTGYPTSAVRNAPGDDFIALGFYSPDTGEFDWQVPHWRTALSEWLGRPVTDDDLTTTISHHQALREMKRLRAGTTQDQMNSQFLSKSGPAPYRGL